MPTVVLWFRRDLRLSDHPALLAAIDAAGPTVGRAALLRGPGPLGSGRRQPSSASWSAACARSTRRSAVTSSCGRATPSRSCLRSRRRSAADVGGRHRGLRALRAPPGRSRGRCARRGRVGRSSPRGRPTPWRRGRSSTGSGQPYKVFTPFSKAWMAHGWPGHLERAGRRALGHRCRPAGLPDGRRRTADLPEPGEAAAKRVGPSVLGQPPRRLRRRPRRARRSTPPPGCRRT